MAASKKAGSKSAASSGKRTTAASGKRTSAASNQEKSLEAFRDALEHSVTLSRDRLQEVVDDAVKRGRLTRRDAEQLVSKLVNRSRSYTDGLLKDFERLLEQTRTDLEATAGKARKRVSDQGIQSRQAASDAAAKAVEAVRDAAESQAARIRGRAQAATGSMPINNYDNLNATEIRSRLKRLGRSELEAVRAYEESNAARKTVLQAIDRAIAS